MTLLQPEQKCSCGTDTYSESPWVSSAEDVTENASGFDPPCINNF